MATSAESGADVGNSSDELVRRLLCKPCREEGETLTAVGFCVNCNEHLCLKCYDVHLIPSLTRKHVLKHFEKEGTTEILNLHESKYSCPQHRDKDIEYHCPTHSFLGCHVCFFRHHKSCQDVVFIPDVTMSASGSGECDQFYHMLTDISTKSTDLVTEIKGNLKNIPGKHLEIITALREFKQEILDMIDALEKELIEKSDDQQKKEITRMEELSVKCETILKEAREMSATMEMLQNKDQSRELYIELVQSENKVINIQEQIKLIEKDKNVVMPLYSPKKNLVEYLKKPSSLGSFVMKSPVIEKLEYVRNINCKSGNDAGDPVILGSVILPGQKLVVTYYTTGNTVKLIDTKQNKIQSDLKLSSGTYDICKITDTSVAVTLPEDNKITFITTDPTLSKEREISVNGKPQGIGHLDGKLVVSYNNPIPKVEIMDMQGKGIKTITSYENGLPLFNRPVHITVYPRNNQIYVSNWNFHNLVSITLDGTVITTYKDSELQYPRQVTFDRKGTYMYVCGQGSHNVHQITEDCQKVKVILENKDGLKEPCCICVDEDGELFYISVYKSDHIKVFKVTPILTQV